MRKGPGTSMLSPGYQSLSTSTCSPPRSSLNSVLLDFYGGFITWTYLTKSLAISGRSQSMAPLRIGEEGDEAESFNFLVTWLILLMTSHHFQVLPKVTSFTKQDTFNALALFTQEIPRVLTLWQKPDRDQNIFISYHKSQYHRSCPIIIQSALQKQWLNDDRSVATCTMSKCLTRELLDHLLLTLLQGRQHVLLLMNSNSSSSSHRNIV